MPLLSKKTSAVREAIALAYAQSDAAPKVVARGKGAIAEQIILKAKEHGIYVHESRDLVALLTQVDIDEHIPAQLYLAIAELLAWIYQIEHGAANTPLPLLSIPAHDPDAPTGPE